MAKKSLLSLLLLTLFTSYTNAGYSVTYPGTGDILEAGKTFNTTWTIINEGVTEPTIDVILQTGDQANLQTVQTLCKGINSSAKACTFTLPAETPTKIDYAIAVGLSPDNTVYSSFFTIKGVGEIPPNTGCPNMGGHVCAGDIPCCSDTGYCGKTAEFCGAGCQQQFSLAGACTGGGKAPTPKRRRMLYNFN